MDQPVIFGNEAATFESGDKLRRPLPDGRAVSRIESSTVEEPEDIAARNIPVEVSGPGGYVVVAETLNGHVRQVGRRLTDRHGQLLAGFQVYSGDIDEQDLTEEFPPRNRYPGVTIRTIGGSRYAVIDMGRLGGKNVGQLARLFHLPAERVIRSLIRLRNNSHVVRQLHDQTAHAWSGLGRARVELRAARPLARNRAIQLQRRQFTVSSHTGRPIYLPATSNFERDYRAYVAWQRRESRRQELHEPLRRLKSQIRDIEISNDSLEFYSSGLRKQLKERVQSLGLLQTIDLMLAVACKFTTGGKNCDSANDIKQFRRTLREATELAREVMVTRPVAYEWWDRNLRSSANELYRHVSSAELTRNMRSVIAYWDLVATSDRARIQSVMLSAYKLLLGSPREQDAARHLRPVLDVLAAGFQQSGASPRGLSREFLSALRDDLSRSSPQVALGYLAQAASAGSRSMARLPGPNSFGISLLRVIGPHLMSHTRNSTQAGRLGGLLYRALMSVTRLDESDASDVLRHIGRQSHRGMADARDVLVARVPARTVSGVLVVLNLAAMLNVWTSDQRLTLRNWADLIGSGIGATLGATRILATLDRLEDARVLTSLTRGAAGEALGVLGGALGVYSGTELAISEYRSGDMVGTWLAGADTAGGAVSVVGFLMTVGAANAWNGVGEVIMLIGALVGLVSFIWGALRDWLTPGVEALADSLLTKFRESDPYRIMFVGTDHLPRASRQRLQQLRDKVNHLGRVLHRTDFWDIHINGSEALLDLDFCPPMIAKLTDKDEDEVIAHLRGVGRWNAADRRRCHRQARSDESNVVDGWVKNFAEGGANRRLTPDEVRFLVLEGGGGKGLVFLGAMRALATVRRSDGSPILAVDRNGRQQNLRGVAGSSAGAITALGISCGMDVDALDRISNPRYQDFDEFFDMPSRRRQLPRIGGSCAAATRRDILHRLIFDPLTVVLGSMSGLNMLPRRAISQLVAGVEGKVFQHMTRNLRPDAGLVDKLGSPAALYYARNLWEDFGLFSGCAVRAFLDGIVRHRGGSASMTFAQHHRSFQTKLIVTGSNLESGRTQLFSVDSTPQMPVVDAVRISMSLPVLYKPIRISLDKAREITRGASNVSPSAYAGLWVDGGLWNNLPMTVFANDEAGRTGTLGIALGDKAQRRTRISSPASFLGALLAKFSSDESLANAYPSYRQQIIALNTGSIGTAEFSPDAAELAQLQRIAQNTTENYFRGESR